MSGGTYSCQLLGLVLEQEEWPRSLGIIYWPSLSFFFCKSRCLTLPFMHSHFLLLCWEKKSSFISSFPSPKRVILSSASRADTWKACGCPWFRTRWARAFGCEGCWALVRVPQDAHICPRWGPPRCSYLRVLLFHFPLICFPFAESKCSQEPHFHSFQRPPWAWTPEPFPCYGGHQPSSPPGGQRIWDATVPKVLAQPHHAGASWHVQ